MADERRPAAAAFAKLTALVLLAPPVPLAPLAPPAPLVLDVLTDLRCPFSYVALRRLYAALGSLGLGERQVELRFHPVFLDASLADSASEELAPYLYANNRPMPYDLPRNYDLTGGPTDRLREHGVTAKAAAAADYPLNQAAAALGFSFHPDRRVLSTARAFRAVALAGAEGGAGAGRRLFDELSAAYFERGADVADLEVILAAAERVGVELGAPGQPRRARARLIEAQAGAVDARYGALASEVQQVPTILLRRRATGDGTLLVGAKSVAQYARHLPKGSPGPLAY